MLYLITKAALSGVIIMVVSEVAQRRPALGALIVSLPLVSILSILWLWRDTGDTVRIAAHAEATFWLVLPTLPMFLVLPALLNHGLGFYASLAISIVVMALCYAAAVPVLARFGITI